MKLIQINGFMFEYKAPSGYVVWNTRPTGGPFDLFETAANFSEAEATLIEYILRTVPGSEYWTPAQADEAGLRGHNITAPSVIINQRVLWERGRACFVHAKGLPKTITERVEGLPSTSKASVHPIRLHVEIETLNRYVMHRLKAGDDGALEALESQGVLVPFDPLWVQVNPGLRCTVDPFTGSVRFFQVHKGGKSITGVGSCNLGQAKRAELLGRSGEPARGERRMVKMDPLFVRRMAVVGMAELLKAAKVPVKLATSKDAEALLAEELVVVRELSNCSTTNADEEDR